MSANELLAEQRDPDGRSVVLLARIWEDKITKDHPELRAHLEHVLSGSSRPWRHARTQAMEAVNVKIGPLVFDHADYDPEGDVLYLHVGAPQDAEGEETPEAMCCASSRAPSASSA